MKDVTSTSKEMTTLSVTSNELSIKDIKGQVTKIQAVMKAVMKDNVHFGTVPGVPQKFLFKAGAEKLCMTFRLIPSYKVERLVHENGHLTYDITCTLTHGPSGATMGEGVGACSTLEKKYRYRNEDIPTGVEIPKAWWNERNQDHLPLILKNNNVTPKTQTAMNKEGLTLAAGKIGKKFEVVYRKKVDNIDIADVYNTVLKMAKKRALVDATITALSVGDMFSQDPVSVDESFDEDAEAAGKEQNKEQPKAEPVRRKRTVKTEIAAKKEEKPASTSQRRRTSSSSSRRKA